MEDKRFTGGFLAEGFNARRQACDMETVMAAACEAHEGVTSKTDLCVSMNRFPAEFVEHVKATGETAGYGGVCWSPMLWFDIDHAGDLPTAVADAVKLVTWLVENFGEGENGLWVEHLQILFSGSKGFHVGIPMSIFGDAAVASETFAAECKAVAMEIAAQAGVKIDTSVYGPVRLLRCLNSKHGGSGLYKIPVRFEELTAHDNVEWLLEAALTPRRLLLTTEDAETDDDAVTCVPVTTYVECARDMWKSVVEQMQEKKEDMDVTGQWLAQTQTLPESGNTYPRLRRTSLEFILDGVPEGERAVRLYQTAADCVRCGWSEDAIFSLLPDAARRTGLGIHEIEKQIHDGIRSEKGGAA